MSRICLPPRIEPSKQVLEETSSPACSRFLS